MNCFDSRLDKRTIEKLEKNIKKWETIEENAIQIFKEDYITKNGGSVAIENHGFRKKGFERDVKKINNEPDFKVRFSDGPYGGMAVLVEVQAMEPDINVFHIKKHKAEKIMDTKSIFLQMNAIGKHSERYTIIEPSAFKRIIEKSVEKHGIVFFPGTICNDFPEGKPAYLIEEEWTPWEYTGRKKIDKLEEWM